MAGFRIVVFSSMPPFEPYRLLDRLEREVSGVEIAGLLYEPRRPKPLITRAKHWLHSLGEPGFLVYALDCLQHAIGKTCSDIGHALLRLAQASGVQPEPQMPSTVAELAEACRGRGWKCLVTRDIHSEESLNFVHESHSDAGIVLGTRILKPVLFNIPRLGSVNIHKHKVPEYRGGGAPGLWELLDGKSEVVLTTHKVEERVDSGAILRQYTLHVDPYDNLESLGLKAGVLGEDLLVETVRDFVQGKVQALPQTGAGKSFRSPKAHELRLYEKKFAVQRWAYRAKRQRPNWKLVLRSSAYLWLLPFRNWSRRAKRKFPLVILFHHLVSEKPHPMAVSTPEFLRHVRYLKRHYKLVSLEEGLRMLRSGRIGEPTAVLTFDDGYEDNFVSLRAVLRLEPAPVTLFVCPELIERRQAFPHDQRDHREGFAPLTPAEVQWLAREGMEIGSHTRTHFNCGSADQARLEGEIAGSRSDLEILLGRPVTLFSFPWGKPANMSAPALALAGAHYEHFFSAYGGVNFPGKAPAHLLRTAHPHSLWELELTLQQLLDFRAAGYADAPPSPAPPAGTQHASRSTKPERGLSPASHSR